MLDLINQALPILTIAAQILIVLLIILLLFTRFGKTSNALTDFIKDNALIIAFIVALVATLGSLFYSEIMGYEPCSLCWYQRILMYPQVILLGMAMVKRSVFIASYSIALSMVGGAIAAFHYYGQTVDNGVLSCDTLGQTASCVTLFVLEYGYITIPMMALTAFVFINSLVCIVIFR